MQAKALLAVAARQQSVDSARIRAFARAVLEADPISAFALSVLDGGLFTGRRVVELARKVVEATCANSDDEHATSQERKR